MLGFNSITVSLPPPLSGEEMSKTDSLLNQKSFIRYFWINSKFWHPCRPVSWEYEGRSDVVLCANQWFEWFTISAGRVLRTTTDLTARTAKVIGIATMTRTCSLKYLLEFCWNLDYDGEIWTVAQILRPAGGLVRTVTRTVNYWYSASICRLVGGSGL